MAFNSAGAVSGAASGAASGASLGGWGAGIGGIAGGLLGGFSGSDDQVNSAQAANDANFAFARETRDWTERMDNSKHQRNVKDLQAAGLNPVLSALHSLSAPSPQLAHSAKNVHEGIPQVRLNSAAATASIAETVARIRRTNAETDNLQGRVSIPGFFSGPLSALKSGFKKLSSKQSTPVSGAGGALKNVVSNSAKNTAFAQSWNSVKKGLLPLFADPNSTV